jgi:hypothetical protein
VAGIYEDKQNTPTMTELEVEIDGQAQVSNTQSKSDATSVKDETITTEGKIDIVSDGPIGLHITSADEDEMPETKEEFKRHLEHLVSEATENGLDDSDISSIAFEVIG